MMEASRPGQRPARLPVVLFIFSGLILAAVISLGAGNAIAGSDRVTVATEIWPPFRIQAGESEGTLTGIDPDLLDELAARLNFTYEIKRYPWARCLNFMETGEMDLITGLAHTPERAEYTLYSDPPYYKVSPAFYVKKGKGRLVARYEDLYAFTIGYSLKSAYFEPFDSDAKLKKYGATTEKQLIKMLADDRLDVIVGTDPNVEYDLLEMGLRDKIEKTAYQPTERTDLFVGISKKSGFVNRAPELNQTLREMIQSGVIEKIAAQYR